MLSAISSGNDTLVGPVASIFSSSQPLANAPKPVSLETRGQWARGGVPRLIFSQEIFIGFEMSLVPEVEAVIVERSEGVKNLRVTTVIDKRDPAVRAKIYARERAIIDSGSFAGVSFDFHVISRLGCALDEIIGTPGKLAWKR
jgi:hypothetical protein